MGLSASQLRKVRRNPGNRIRAARQAMGLTQLQLCRLLSITQPALSDLENNRAPRITVDRARKYAVFFGCRIEDLFPAAAERLAS